MSHLKKKTLVVTWAKTNKVINSKGVLKDKLKIKDSNPETNNYKHYNLKNLQYHVEEVEQGK